MVPGSRSTRTARGTYLFPLAWDTVRIEHAHVVKSNASTNLVEVDVHALQLEIGGAIVPVPQSGRDPFSGLSETPKRWLGYIHTRAVQTMLASDSLPAYQLENSNWHPGHSESMFQGPVVMVETYQKAAPIWLPYHPNPRLVSRPKRTNSHIYNGQGRTYTLAGLKVNLEGRGSQHESMAERVGSQG